ncbi:MAG: cupin domain-containing protein [Deltaproteobacteria bacterium]|nr:cupin domain-containing protein [Deltaproteobacteria bacterium]
MKITVEQPTPELLDAKGVSRWPTLEKEPCRIDWYFDQTEESYFLDGAVTVVTEDGQRVTVRKGDLAVFPKGLRCTWYIEAPLRKHFNLRDD